MEFGFYFWYFLFFFLSAALFVVVEGEFLGGKPLRRGEPTLLCWKLTKIIEHGSIWMEDQGNVIHHQIIKHAGNYQKC